MAKKLIIIFILISIFFHLRLHAQVGNFQAPNEDDNFITFIESDQYFSNVFALEANGLQRGQSTMAPWSGSYWPIHKGILALRYADNSISTSSRFYDNYIAHTSRSPDVYVQTGNIDKLSPAEKYDLLVGDSNWTLSRAMWAKGLRDYQEDGVVATWTGICHGLAAATHMQTPMPINAVTVKDVSGSHSITFYAADIKGLASYLWAESSPPSVKAGNRCRQGGIDRDPYLRPIDPSCLDSNPMSWHMTVTNRLGLAGKSFVMDASVGPEVWNYAISSYDYSYFNPRTLEPTFSLNAAIVPIEKMTNDRYTAHRNPNSKYLVGVVMDVYHPSLTEPRPGNSSNISMQTNKFYYDLELDQNFSIIGGEWYSAERPDFLWSFPKDSIALTREDAALADVSWDGRSALPPALAVKAIEASHREKVMAKIVGPLVIQSNVSLIQ